MKATSSKLMRSLSMLTLGIGVLSLTACAGMDPRTRDTAAGAAIGGVAGSVLTGGTAAGAIGGAVVGGVIGNQNHGGR
jgi:osmotically inducible lipoprotein OsmB